MTWLLTWLNVRVATLNSTLQLLVIYRFLLLLLIPKLCNSNYLVMTLAMAKLYNSIGRVNDGSNGIYMLRNNKYK